MSNQEFINIDGQDYPIEGERNILEIIRKASIDLPTFCYHSELSVYGACRLCMVEIDGNNIQASCSTPPAAGMKIKTTTSEIRTIRKVNLELLLANHDISCPSCSRSNNCKLQDLSRRLGVDERYFKKTDKIQPIDNHSHSIVYDPNKCVLCGDCIRACKEIQSVGAIDFSQRGAHTMVSAAFRKSLAEVECVYCGQCVSVCPVGALTPKPETDQVWKALADPTKTVVAQVAPAVRVAIGEGFGLEAGESSMGQIVAALKKLGFDQVYDTSFAADLTIIEEANEFIKRKTEGGVLPMFTSCCPSWVKFVEQYYTDLIPNLSSCKSPQQMMGSVAKEILPEILKIDKKDLVVVSIMPCTAKKYEAKREEFIHEFGAEVDHVLTTEGLGRMIDEAGIQFAKLIPESLDHPLGFKTGAGVLFGNSGGVTEAVLRFAYEKLSGEKLQNKDFLITRGKEGIREAAVRFGNTQIKIAMVHSLSNARKIANEIAQGKSDYDFVEVMACPGGCIAGGGQPISFDVDFKAKRTAGLYRADTMLQLHKPQDNPYVKSLYETHLHEPGGEAAHHLLHTHYHGRRRIENIGFSVKGSDLAKIHVNVCVGTNCFVKGSQEILKQLVDFVSENQLTERVSFGEQHEAIDIKATFCFEKCESAPVVSINGRKIEKASFELAKEALLMELENYSIPVAGEC
jgi:NADH-quinone oxidoreductase subunit G